MFELNNFDSIQIGLASPETIRNWSHGEVTKSETVNYRTQKPEKDGLFCEKIFGPTKDFECHCGKYKRIRYAGVVCDKCGVKVTKSKVRREWMGHIELAAPVSHIWFFRGVPSKIGQVLGMGTKQLEHVIYFADYVVLDPGQSGFQFKDVISETQYQECMRVSPDCGIKVGMGAEAIQELLRAVDLEEESKALKKIIDDEKNGTANRLKAVKRLDVIEAFRLSGAKPEWMILNVLPVLPPDLRPMVPLDGGRFATSDLNDLYRKVIDRNNRLKKLIESGSPEIIVRNEKRMLQDAVDSLIDNGKRGKPITGQGGKELKSLSQYLRGKQGRFRMNLLGKRVDYSGRSVIVVGPELKIHQCGLPKEMAIELFKPFVMRELMKREICKTEKNARKLVDRMDSRVWPVLEDVIKDHPVMLNRAPTLHRLSIQAFEPVLIDGRAIKLHPLVCSAFNADFDGDQMAIHVPLSIEAQTEARFLMLSSNNVLKLSDGKPVMSPSQDMVLGCYYLTMIRRAEGNFYADNAYYEYIYADDKFFKNDDKIKWTLNPKDKNYCAKVLEQLVPSDCVFDESGNIIECTLSGMGGFSERVKKYVPQLFISPEEAFTSYQTKNLHLEDEIYVRRTVEIPASLANSDVKGKITEEDGKFYYTYRIKTTCGRIIFNEEIPQDLGFQKRETPDDYLKYEIEDVMVKGKLKDIVQACYDKKSATCAVETLDYIKALGYKYSTIGSISTSIFDMKVPDKKNKIIEKADKDVIDVEKLYDKGFYTDEERYIKVIDIWKKATDDVTSELEKTLDKFNPIWMMANSKARGDMNQIKQLSGMRGLVQDPSGKTIEIPIKSNFREGLSILEYFVSSHGGRKGLADTALKTADSGYLTRRLVDISHSVIVKEEDCFASKGMSPQGREIRAIVNPKDGKAIVSLKDRIAGRFTIEDIVNPTTGEIICKADTMISPSQASEVEKAGIEKVNIRTLLSCCSRDGVCVKCYGRNMSNLDPVQIGEAVGTIAAQSIGEPGTQLTMRTFHTGGIASDEDITQGLPRVEELFEARKPPIGKAILSEVAGIVQITRKDNIRHVIIKNIDSNGNEIVLKDYDVPFRSDIKVSDGDSIHVGDVLTSGSIYPQELLKLKGPRFVEDYIVSEVQKVYRSQSVEINDKHIEIIVRQMLKKVLVQSSGETDLLAGELVDREVAADKGDYAIGKGLMPPTVQPVLLGITKASLNTESFLSSASFQETTKVLTDAAVKGKIDKLKGLKENIIIGKLIPAGTGCKEYRNLHPQVNRFGSTDSFQDVNNSNNLDNSITDDNFDIDITNDFLEDEDI